MESRDRVDLRTVIRVIVRRRLAILAVGLVAGGAAYGLSFLQPVRYDASAELLFQKADYAQTLFGSSSQSGSTDPQREAATDLALASLEAVAARAARDLGTHLTVEQLRKKVDFSPVGQADLVRVTGHARTPTEAATIANTFAREVVAVRREAAQAQVQQAITSVAVGKASGSSRTDFELTRLQALKALQTGDVEVVQPAIPPLHRAAPRPIRNGLIGAGAGLILGTLGILMLYRLDRRVRDPDQAAELFGAPLLATLPIYRSLTSKRNDPKNDAVFFESFQFLRSNLQLQDLSQDSRVIAVTSAVPGDGKTTVAVRLARALSVAGSRVIAVDCDLRKPMLHRAFGLSKGRGLSEVLTAGDDPSVLARSGLEGVRVLSGGLAAVSPAIAVSVNRLPDVIRAVAEDADYVILDTPPIQVAAEASSIAAVSDGVVVVVDISRDTRDVLQATRRQLEHAHARILGVVVNRDRSASTGSTYYEYYADGSARAEKAGEPERDEDAWEPQRD